MTETQWRFLKAIADNVADGRIVEVRLFPAIRQGGAESGVAVVAVEELKKEVPHESEVDESVAAEVSTAEMAVADDSDTLEASADDVAGLRWDKPRLIVDIKRDIETVVEIRPESETAEAEVQTAWPDDDTMQRIAAPDVHFTSDFEVMRPVKADVPDESRADVEPALTVDDMLNLSANTPDSEAPRATPKRYAVLAARYRLTLKGPDRGHWDFEMTHEADAPLETVDRVARGVARRAGDEGEPEALSAYQLQSTLSQPWWNSAT